MAKDSYISGLKWLAIYERIGGLLGIFFATPMLGSLFSYGNLHKFEVFSGIIVFLFSIYAGIVLFRGQQHSIEISMACQCLQMAIVWTSNLTYQFVAGLSLAIGFDLADGLSLRFTGSLSAWVIDVSGNSGSNAIFVNLLALGVWFILNHERKAIEQDKKTDLIKSIAE